MLRGLICCLLLVQFFRPELLTRFKPELDAFMHFLIFRFTIYADVPSPGNQLQNICYREFH